jgi:phospholipid/cholesterol/gamma-HCH transport system substrate-binding protein
VKISKEVKVGFLGIIALVILYIGINFLRGSNLLSPYNTYYVIYHHVDGLDISNPVLVRGISVGRVDDIQILRERDHQVLVTLKIDADLQLGDSTTAFLISSDILGSKAVDIEMGPNSRILQNKDTLRGEIAQGISEIINEKALPVVDKLDSTIVLINAILTNLYGNGDRFNDIMNNIKLTSDRIRIMANKNDAALNQIVLNMEKLTKKLNDPKDGVGALLAKFNTIADSIDDIEFKKMVADTEATIAQFKLLANELNEGKGSMGKLLKDDSLYVNMNKTAADLDLLLIDLRERPKRYVHFSLFGRKEKEKDQKE